MGRRQRNYFEMLKGLADDSVTAARMLQDILRHYNVQKLPGWIGRMHEIEHAADRAKHDMTNLLAKEFLPPIDRGDIILLSQEIDDITDSVEDVLLRLYMFNIQIIRPDALRFAELILSCCSGFAGLMDEFENYKKSTAIRKIVAEVNRLESDGVNLYTNAIRKLYTSSYSPTEIYAWTVVFDHMQQCCDACEQASESVETIIMKNS